MKYAMILLLVVLAPACGPAAPPRDTGPDGSSAHHRRSQKALRYKLVGLPTGPKLYYDEARCLQSLKTYSDGMEAGLGMGSSGRLHCEPE
jgi:hypothetical protein